MWKANILFNLAYEMREKCRECGGSCPECSEARNISNKYSCSFTYVKDLLFYKPLGWNLEEIQKGLTDKELSDMNECQIIGNLTDEPRRFETDNGNISASFTLAVDRTGKDKGTDFLPMSAWGPKANYLLTYCHKGDKLSIIGRLASRQIVNEKGQSINNVGIVVKEVKIEKSCKQKEDNEE